jgi:hypothetical protein
MMTEHTDSELPLTIERRRCKDCRGTLPENSRVYRCAACVLAAIARRDANADL